MTRHEDKDIEVMVVGHGDDASSLAKGDEEASFDNKDWLSKREKPFLAGDRFFLVAMGILLLSMAGVEVAQLITSDSDGSKQIYYGVAGLVLVLCLGTTLVLYVKSAESKEEEQDSVEEAVFTSNKTNRRGSIDTLETGSLGGSLPPSPPPPPLRKELSTATVQHDNRSTAVAEYFPSVSVIFVDIVGFTAWSSIRDPYQVFTLLETLYEAFDKIAEAKSVFKVETIGDCWVGASGLPKPRGDHAVIISTFARRALDKSVKVFSDLEETLGPGTAELGIRMGIHSGSVMAGVLRGAKSRYQLFGDTMNVTSRIESTGTKNKIHLSEPTAELLQAAGKGEWVEQREDKVLAKGKGELQTFWLTTSAKNLSPDVKLALPAISKFLQKAKVEPAFCTVEGNGRGRLQRLVDYNTKVMERLLKRVVAVRGNDDRIGTEVIETIAERYTPHTIVDEAKKDIPFMSDWQYIQDPKRVDLGQHVVNQLESFVTKVASLYRDLPFHCFEHASHTILSVTKLLASLEATLGSYHSQHQLDFESRVNENVCEMLTHPMAQFALVFAAMVHDIEYEAPNYQLVREGSKIAKTFKGKSCAEQNSIHSAWTLLMQPAYTDLRECLFGSQQDLEFFRSLLVKSVMATDVFDKDQATARTNRWEMLEAGFVKSTKSRRSEEKLSLQKAAVVVEHLIQISDVSHTVQHLNVYTKWNKLLFKEMFLGYKAGRAGNDPSENWYGGELKFFDSHVIPLAQRLCDCQVFRASAEICLTNAINNRRKWEQKGRLIVDEGLKLYETKSVVTSVIAQRVRRVPSMIPKSR